MREFVEFFADGDSEVGAPPGWPELAVAALRPLGPKVIKPWPIPDPPPLQLCFEFDYYPEELQTIEAQLRRQGLSVDYWVRCEYTAAEVRQAELLVAGPGRVLTSVEDTLHWEDVTVCRSCGTRTAHWQYESLQIVEPPQGAELANVDHWPLVCSAELAQALREARVTGLALVPVGPDRPVQWYGLLTTHELPPLASPPTRLVPNPARTPQCLAHHLWSSNTSPLAYRRRELGAADFNHTYEYYGGVETAVRLLVISQRVYRLFGEVGVKRRNGYPVEVVD